MSVNVVPTDSGYFFTSAYADRRQSQYKPHDINQKENQGHPEMYALGVTVTVLAAGAFIAANIVTFPFAGPISLLALGILSAVSYGIINDQLACRQCIEYFTVGHTAIHKRLLETDDPTINGIVWGIHATWVLGAVAGAAMAVAAIATGVVVSQIMPILVPVIAIGIGAACAYSHYKALQEEEYWKLPENKEELDAQFDGMYIPPNEGFHRVNLDRIPHDKRAAYMGVGKRNEIGYNVMPMLGGALLIGEIALGILL